MFLYLLFICLENLFNPMDINKIVIKAFIWKLKKEF